MGQLSWLIAADRMTRLHNLCGPNTVLEVQVDQEASVK